MTELPTEVTVWLDAAELGPRRRVGVLRLAGAEARSVISFSYEKSWLAETGSFALDPSHHLYEGAQYSRDGGLAGVFSDTAPDRWGRTLMERREALHAREEGRRPRSLGDRDFLLGVTDSVRMGALRYCTSDGRFLDDDAATIPPTARLRELEQAARDVERPNRGEDSEESRRLAILLAPGSSLGGARPKASFYAEERTLWLAKFPSRNDRRDVAAWEYVLNKLASRAGIVVPEARLLRLSADHRTFAARRFDRDGSARRLFASAMTLTGKRDRDEASYLDIALAIADQGAPTRIGADLEQMFRRVAFNVLTGHRDDHLRNHGFLRTREGWRLAPAFDLNPMPDKPEHELAIDESIRRPDIELVSETAPFYRLSAVAAKRIIDDVREAVRGWRSMAAEVEMSTDEMDLLAATFAA